MSPFQLNSIDWQPSQNKNIFPTWFVAWQQENMRRFQALGLPTKKQEDWKYTALTELAQEQFLSSSENKIAVTDTPTWETNLTDAYCLVFRNGQFYAELSSLNDLPSSVVLGSYRELARNNEELAKKILQQCARGETAFHALNAAFMQDALVIYLPSQTIIEKPIHLLHIYDEVSDLAIHTRCFIILEHECQAVIFEEHRSHDQAKYFMNVVVNAHVGREAQLHYYKLQQVNAFSYHIANTDIYQQQNSQVAALHVGLGGKLSRENIHCFLDGPGAHCELKGLYLVAGKQHMDYQTCILHQAKQTLSQQDYRGIVAGQACAIFNGKVMVAPDAPMSQAQQINRNLLLSPAANVNTKPELMIYVDDVQCTHSATVGELDEEALFYLRSRGFDEQEARRILTQAFMDELLGSLSKSVISPIIQQQVVNKLYQEQKL